MPLYQKALYDKNTSHGAKLSTSDKNGKQNWFVNANCFNEWFYPSSYYLDQARTGEEFVMFGCFHKKPSIYGYDD